MEKEIKASLVKNNLDFTSHALQLLQLQFVF